MSLATTTKISLDLYNNNVVTINAKQLDNESRYVNVTCTDYGRKVTLDSSSLSAFVRYKKSDGNDVFNEATILEDGTIQIKLTQQMLATEGRQTADVLILSVAGLTVDDLTYANDFSVVDTRVMSTMTFYINVIPDAVDHNDVASTSEFDALTTAIAKVKAMEIYLEDLCKDIIGQTGFVLTTGDTMTGDLGVPNLTAQESVSIADKAKFHYDEDLDAIVLTFL